MSEKTLRQPSTRNEATSNIAHLCNEVMAIYPITPSSGMGEMPDAWAAAGRKNIFGTVPHVVEMQSEAGAAGAVHGSLQAGALTSTFTASQGLLLMIPNMFKIAGELTSTVFHVSARTIATHALSIFGDHSDVMACRSTGWAMLASGSVQEAQDMAVIAHSATLKARVPFVHFFDGFRISHEVNRIEQLSEDDVRAMIDMDLVQAHRNRALNPEKPVLRGTAQKSRCVLSSPRSLQSFLRRRARHRAGGRWTVFAKLTGRQYHLFDYVGAPDAERVIVCMTSGCGIVEDTVESLVSAGEKVGLVKVRLYRPFDSKAFVAAMPTSVKVVAVLDRTKEPGADGEPLFQDVVTAMVGSGRTLPKLIGGRYGLSSKEFTPAMVAGVFAEMSKADPKPRFTVGINDDVTHLSLDYDESFSTEADDVIRAMFFGLGSDGTVGANKKLGQNRGREHAPLRPGLFRLRLEEGRFGNRLAPAFQPAADQRFLSGAQGQFHRLSPDAIHRSDRHAFHGCPRRHVPAEHPQGSRRGLGFLARRGAKRNRGQEDQALCHRRLQGRREGPNGCPASIP